MELFQGALILLVGLAMGYRIAQSKYNEIVDILMEHATVKLCDEIGDGEEF